MIVFFPADMNVDSLRDAVSHIDIAKIHDTMSKLPPQLQDMMAKAGRKHDSVETFHICYLILV